MKEWMCDSGIAGWIAYILVLKGTEVTNYKQSSTFEDFLTLEKSA